MHYLLAFAAAFATGKGDREGRQGRGDREGHFGSIVTRKYKNHPTIKTESGSKGSKIFLLKWGITINFFKKYILNSDTKFIAELKTPKKTFPQVLKKQIDVSKNKNNDQNDRNAKIYRF